MCLPNTDRALTLICFLSLSLCVSACSVCMYLVSIQRAGGRIGGRSAGAVQRSKSRGAFPSGSVVLCSLSLAHSLSFNAYKRTWKEMPINAWPTTGVCLFFVFECVWLCI